jgi:hypothetical protein
MKAVKVISEARKEMQQRLFAFLEKRDASESESRVTL